MGRIRPLRERLRRMLQPEHLKRETERMAQDAAFNSFLMNLIASWPARTASDASDLLTLIRDWIQWERMGKGDDFLIKIMGFFVRTRIKTWISVFWG